MLTFIDLFAGIGGFRRGLELAGWKCVGFCEWDKFATASYTSMHLLTDEQREFLGNLDKKKRQKEILKEEYRNGEWYCDDIRKVNGGNIPECDCWCFGSPCTDFSVAGKRKGLGGDASSLIREVFRVLGEIEEENRPEWLIYENVKGMLSSNRGFDFLAILLEMDELGYDVEWDLFNTKDFGPPQNRERIYTVGHLRKRGSAKVFPVKGTDGKNCVQTVKQVGRCPTAYRDNPQVFRVYDPNGISPTLNTMGGGHREPMIVESVDWVLSDAKCIDPQGRLKKKVVLKDEVPTLRAQSHGNDPEVVIPVLTPDREKKRQQGRRFKESGESFFTLTAQDRHGVAIGIDDTYGYEDCARIYEKDFPALRSSRSGLKVAVEVDSPEKGKRQDGFYVELYPGCIVYAMWNQKYQCYVVIRKLTPRESFRLQGWDDVYFDRAEFVTSNSQLYKQAGNGVSVPVSYAVADAINGHFVENDRLL